MHVTEVIVPKGIKPCKTLQNARFVSGYAFRHDVSLKMELALAAGVRCERLFPQPQNRSQITRFMLISQIISLIQRWN
jgi:hypothetical protein